jgi:hypothetical protein
MITLFVLFILFMLFIGIGLKITGALLTAVIWLCIKLPIAFILILIGLVLCCTIILIPIGIGAFKAGLSLLTPRCAY